MPAFQGSASDRFVQATVGLSQELDRFGTLIRQAKTPQEMQALTAAMKGRIDLVMAQEAEPWRKGLLSDFKSEYRRGAGHDNAIDRASLQASYRLGAKSKASADKLRQEAHRFVDNQVHNVAVSKAKQAAKDQYVELGKRLPRQKGAELAATKAKMAKLQQTYNAAKIKEVPNQPTVRYNRRGRNGTVKQVEVPMEHYATLAGKTLQSRVSNFGLARGAAKRPAAKWICVDGEGCGWTSHDDSEPADGKVVTAEQMMKYPISHPFCVRRFEEATDEEAKSAKKAHAITTRAVQKAIAKEIARQQRKATGSQKLKTAMVLAKVGVNVYNSTALRILAGAIYDNSADLPPLLSQFAKRWAKYSTREDAFVAARVEAGADKVLTLDDFRYDVVSKAEKVLSAAGEGDTITMPKVVSSVLHLDSSVPYETARSALSDYSDFIAHNNGINKVWYENVKDSHLWQSAKDAIANDSVSETMRLMTFPRVPTGYRDDFRGTLKVLKSAYQQDSHRISKAAVGDLANAIDPLSWSQTALGNFRFMVHTSATERRALAERIFEQVSQSRRYAPDQIADMKALGLLVNGADRVALRDAVNVLIPRVTFNPGGLFSTTIGMEKGSLVPAFRVHAPGMLGRVLSLESKLSGGAMGRLYERIWEGAFDFTSREGIVQFLQSVDSEMITNIGIWRNGPISGNIKMHGQYLNSIGFKLKGDQTWLRAAGTWKRFEQRIVGYQNVVVDGIEQVVPIYDDKLGQLFSDIAVLPGRLASFTASARGRVMQDVTWAMYRYSGSMMETARNLGVSFETVAESISGIRDTLALEWVNLSDQVKSEFSSFQEYWDKIGSRLSKSELTRIRSLQDLVDYTTVFTNPEQITAHKLALNTLDEQGGFARAERAKFVDGVPGHLKMAMSDVADVQTLVEHDFPAMKGRWKFQMIEGEVPEKLLDAAAMYDYDAKAIKIYEGRATTFIYKTFDRAMARARRSGWLVDGVGREQIWWHETGHFLEDNLSLDQTKNLWKRITGMPGQWPLKGLDPGHTPLNPFGSMRFDLSEQLGLASTKAEINDVIYQWMHLDLREAGAIAKNAESHIQRALRRKVSKYAATDPSELIAELIAEAQTSYNPSELSKMVYQYMKDALR